MCGYFTLSSYCSHTVDQHLVNKLWKTNIALVATDIMYVQLSGSLLAAGVPLSMEVLKIVGIGRKSYGFGKILRFKNQPGNRLYPKKLHW